jgi:hypothetical protein
MQTSQAIFSALLLSIIAAAGLVKGIDTAWIFAGITAALAFFSLEMRNDAAAIHSAGFEVGAKVLALASWVTGCVAAFALLV